MVSGIVSSGTGQRARTAGTAGTAGTVNSGRRRHRGRWAAAALAVVVIAGVVVAVASGAFGPRTSPGSASGSYQTSTALVTRRTLTSQTQVNATLGDNGAYNVVDQSAGTITWLPQVGQVIGEGHVLYQVGGVPVFLLYGMVPSWESLSEGMTGPDVAELNKDLVKMKYLTAAELGPRAGWDYFSGATAYGLAQLQTKLGLAVTGTLPLGQADVLPSSAVITGFAPTTVLGGTAAPGTALMTASSTVPVVIINLDADQQTEVKAGDKVTITLPSGSNTPGVVSSVGTVATAPAADSSGSTEPTIPVIVTLTHPKAAGRLDQAPVTVEITTASVSNVLVVPVDALLAKAGGYEVEVTGPSGHHLVKVSVGLFDDALGLVQVSGPGLAPGQRVVVPAI